MSYIYHGGGMRPFARFFSITFVLSVLVIGGIFISHPGVAQEKAVVPDDFPDTIVPETIDDMYGRIADEVPGFGGMYKDQDTLYVQMAVRGSEKQQAAVDAIGNTFGPDRVDGQNIVFLATKYDFNQLRTWYKDFLKAITPLKGFTTADIDERNNRLTVGIESEDQKPEFEKALSALNIPADAMAIEVNGPITSISLSDYTRPLVAGLRTTRAGTGDTICSLGPNGIRSGTYGFLTASHCTVVMGPDTSTTFYQGDIGIGTENGASSDPAYFQGGDCPAGLTCRYSDAAFLNKYTGTTMSVGRIARPSSSDHTEPITWNGTDNFRIVGEKLAVPGDTITMVGATTGRLSGTLVDTCILATSDGYTKLCQQSSTYDANPGDSGSPAFIVTNSPATNDALLVGINWGVGGGKTFFSPIGERNIKRDLGGFVTADPTICPNCRNWDHYYVWRGGSQASNKAVWWSANQFIARYDEVKYVQFNSGGGSSGWADSAYVKFCPDLNANGEPINCIGEKYVSNINDYGTTTVTYSPALTLTPGKKYWLSVNTGGSNKVLLYYSNYGTTDYTEGCNKWTDGTLYNTCSIDLNGTVQSF